MAAVTKNRTYGKILKYKTKSIKILQIWWKKGNNSKMGNQIYFKIARYVDLDVLIIFTPCQNTFRPLFQKL
jgi:hypothetical protein